jgi:hypothetical protein
MITLSVYEAKDWKYIKTFTTYDEAFTAGAVFLNMGILVLIGG